MLISNPTRLVEVFLNINNLFGQNYATFGLMGTNIYTGEGKQFRTSAPGMAVLFGIRYGFGHPGLAE